MSTLVTTNLKHGGAASPNIVLNSDGDVTFGGDVTLGTSVLAAPTGSAPSYTCRAWVNFNGTGTVAIRASGNVSSITDNGTGDYTINFTTAMVDANYAVMATTERTDVANGTAMLNPTSPPTTTAARVRSVVSLSTAYDPNYFFVAIFR